MMDKGIAVECPCCGTKQEITAMVAHDIFGFSLDQVQHILHDYREQVPAAESVARHLTTCHYTRLMMFNLLDRVYHMDGDAEKKKKLAEDIEHFFKAMRTVDILEG